MKGQKVCQKCGKGNGPRSFFCSSCKSPFTFMKSVAFAKAKSSKKTKYKATRSSDSDNSGVFIVRKPRIIHAPAGECPVDLTDFTYDGVRKWSEMVKKSNPNVIYTAYSLQYFLKYFVDDAELYDELADYAF